MTEPERSPQPEWEDGSEPEQGELLYTKNLHIFGRETYSSPILQASRASPVPCKLYGSAANMQQEFQELLGL